MDIIKFLDLHVDIINYILVICDYKSILHLNCTCKLINNIDLEDILINKSKRLKISNENKTYYVPRTIAFNRLSLLSYDDMIISIIKYLLDNYIEFAYDDIILTDNYNRSLIIGFSGTKDIITTSNGTTIIQTYYIFCKLLNLDYFSKYQRSGFAKIINK